MEFARCCIRYSPWSGTSPLGSLCLELGWPPHAARLLCRVTYRTQSLRKAAGMDTIDVKVYRRHQPQVHRWEETELEEVLLRRSTFAFDRSLALHPDVFFTWSWVGLSILSGVQSPPGPNVCPKTTLTTPEVQMRIRNIQSSRNVG